MNRYTGVFAPAPALVQLETNVIRWFARAVGYPESAGGFLTSGGSLANFSAVVAARHEKLPENFLKGTLYVSDQGHHCIRKAALLAGFPAANVREIPSDAAFRIRLDALAERVARGPRRRLHAVPRRRERGHDEHRRGRRPRRARRLRRTRKASGCTPTRRTAGSSR